MKHILILCLAVGAMAMPQQSRDEERYATIVRHDVNYGPGPADFQYAYETSNGIREDREGYEGEKGQSNMRGSFSFPLPDGTTAEFTYVADESGYKVESPLIPPLPQFVLDQIRFAEEQRALGVTWEKK